MSDLIFGLESVHMKFIRKIITYIKHKIVPAESDTTLLSGRDLDAVASLIGLERRPKESDSEFRQRIREHIFDFPTL